MSKSDKSYRFGQNQCPIVHHSFNKWDESVLINEKCRNCKTLLCYYSSTGKPDPDKIILCDECKSIKEFEDLKI